MEIELRPFSTPNFVIQVVPARPRQDGWMEAPKYALSEVDVDTLSDLCDTFRKEIFAKAGKPDPELVSR